MEYEEILEKKKVKTVVSGFKINANKLNKMLKPFQKHCVEWALFRGKSALFEDCGLGKTFQQLEWAHQVAIHCQRPVLILAPLAVTEQTILEGVKFGIDVYKYDFNCTPNENEPDVFISNYEQLDNIDCSVFAGVVLDESSILKNFTGVYKNKIIELFRNTPYKLACTATPSPNDLNTIS